jgi:3-methyladenine DNA glycosylase AlkD
MSRDAVRAEADGILAELRALGSEANRKGMARYGINTGRAIGVSIAAMRPIARRHRRRHDLALALWASGWHEARILASLIDDPKAVTAAQMDRWVAACDSWDLCDQMTSKLFALTPFAAEKIRAWAEDEREFVRRAAFALLVGVTVHDKKLPDAALLAYLPLIEKHAGDGRNFVKKAVNWALRQIGKRSPALHGPALELAEKLAASPDPARRWIGRDAVRELSDPRQVARIAGRRR